MSVYNYKDMIDEIMDSVKTAYPSISYFYEKKDLNSNKSTGYICFYIDSESIVPATLNSLIEDGYETEILCFRKLNVKCHIKYKTIEECHTILNALIAGNYNASNSCTGISYPDNRETNSQGCTIVLSFELNLPVSKRINRIIDIKYMNIDPEFGTAEYESDIYNPDLEIPPKFDLIP